MHGRRNATRDIWRAVVMAGAMLGAGCSGSSKPAATAAPVAAEPVPAEEGGGAVEEPAAMPEGDPEMVSENASEMAKKKPPAVDAGIPDAAPPDARPRKRDGKPRGRGFILA